MSTLNLTPKSIEPGWWSRWPQEGWALVRRKPWSFTLSVLLTSAIALCPQYILFSFVTVAIGAWVMILLRAADHGSVVWALLKGSIRDVSVLARDIFLMVFIISLISVLFAQFQGTLGQAMHTVPIPPAAWRILPDWLRSWFNTATSDQMISGSPWLSLMLFIVLARGVAMGFYMLNLVSFKAMLKNRIPTFALVVLGMAPQWIQPIVHQCLHAWMVIVAVAGVVLCNYALLVSSYLFGRETFEGQTTNAHADRKVGAAIRQTQYA